MVMGNSGAYNLGNAVGRMIISSEGVDSGIAAAKQSLTSGLQQMGNSLQGFGQQMTSLGASLTLLTAPLMAFGVTGLKVAADFDSVMNQIRIFGSVTTEELEAVKKSVLDWGAATKFSATDAAEAMLGLLKAGQNTNQALATMPAVLNLAGAGNLSLAQSASMVTTALAQFRLEATDAARVSDALARAANSSQADVSDLGQALSNVGPLAAQFGMSIEETTATLAVFSDNGIRGADAGTMLKSMLLNLSRPTEDVQKAFQKLGVQLYDNQGNTRKFNTVLLELKTALSKLPIKEQNELMHTLAGSFGITGLNALMASDGIGAMLDEMSKAPDAAYLASEQMNTFEGKIESLRGSIETLQIQALEPLMNEYLAPLVDKVIEIVNSITLWMQQNPELAGQIVQIVAGITVLGPILVAVGMAIAAIGSIIGIIASPVALLIGLIAGLVLAFQPMLGPMLENIKTGLETLFGVIRNFGDLVQTRGVGTAIASLVNAFLQMFGLVPNDQMSPILEDIGKAIDGLGGAPEILSKASQAARDLVALGLMGLGETLSTAAQSARDLLGSMLILGGETLITASQSAQDLANIGLVLLTKTIKDASDAADKLVKIAGDWLEKNRPLLINIGEMALSLFAAQGLIAGFNAIQAALAAGATARSAFALWVSGTAGPLLALAAAIYAVVKAFESLQKFNADVGASMVSTQGAIAPWVAQGGTMEDYHAALFKALSAQWGDVAARIVFASPTTLRIFDAPYYAAKGNVNALAAGGQPGAQPKSRDSGGFGVADVPYLIGPSQKDQEVFVPRSSGEFIPNFMNMVKDALTGGNKEAGMFAGATFNIYANNAAGGEEAANSFSNRLMERWRSRGNG